MYKNFSLLQNIITLGGIKSFKGQSLLYDLLQYFRSLLFFRFWYQQETFIKVPFNLYAFANCNKGRLSFAYLKVSKGPIKVPFGRLTFVCFATKGKGPLKKQRKGYLYRVLSSFYRPGVLKKHLFICTYPGSLGRATSNDRVPQKLRLPIPFYK